MIVFSFIRKMYNLNKYGDVYISTAKSVDVVKGSVFSISIAEVPRPRFLTGTFISLSCSSITVLGGYISSSSSSMYCHLSNIPNQLGMLQSPITFQNGYLSMLGFVSSYSDTTKCHASNLGCNTIYF